MRTYNHGNYFTKASTSGRQSFQRLLEQYSKLITCPPRTVSHGRLEALRLHAAAQVFHASLKRRKPGYNHLAIGHDVAEMAKSAPAGLKSVMADRRTADKLLMDIYHDAIQKEPALRDRLARKPVQHLNAVDQAYQDRDEARTAHSRIVADATARIAEARAELRACTDTRDQLLECEAQHADLVRACAAVEAAAALFVTRMREQNERIAKAGRAVDEAQARLQAARDAHLATIRAKADQ